MPKPPLRSTYKQDCRRRFRANAGKRFDRGGRMIYSRLQRARPEGVTSRRLGRRPRRSLRRSTCRSLSSGRRWKPIANPPARGFEGLALVKKSLDAHEGSVPQRPDQGSACSNLRLAARPRNAAARAIVVTWERRSHELDVFRRSLTRRAHVALRLGHQAQALRCVDAQRPQSDAGRPRRYRRSRGARCARDRNGKRRERSRSRDPQSRRRCARTRHRAITRLTSHCRATIRAGVAVRMERTLAGTLAARGTACL